ncbi:MAG: 30S ribosomal protein S6 [bacterium]
MIYYETLLIINPNLSEEEVETVAQKVKKIVEDLGASIIQFENWGKRRLAYEVKKFKKGYYLAYDYQVESSDILKKLDAAIRYDEQILKYMTVNMKEANIGKGSSMVTAKEGGFRESGAAEGTD